MRYRRNHIGLGCELASANAGKMPALPGRRPHEMKDFIRNESDCSGEPEPDLSRAEGPPEDLPPALLTVIDKPGRALGGADLVLAPRPARRKPALFPEWAKLRVPASTMRAAIRAGLKGAQEVNRVRWLESGSDLAGWVPARSAQQDLNTAGNRDAIVHDPDTCPPGVRNARAGCLRLESFRVWAITEKRAAGMGNHSSPFSREL